MATTTELRELLAAATKGPWKATQWEADGCTIIAEDIDIAGVLWDADANAAIIVAAVNSLPGLLDERDALIRKLRSHCNSASSPGVHAFALELLKMMEEE